MTTCIARTIWEKTVSRSDTTTAQGRAAMDQALRAELSAIPDHRLRDHAAEMLRQWRKAEFFPPGIEDRLARIERALAAAGLLDEEKAK